MWQHSRLFSMLRSTSKVSEKTQVVKEEEKKNRKK